MQPPIPPSLVGLNPSQAQAAQNAASALGWQLQLLIQRLPPQLERALVSYPPPPGALPETPLTGPVAVGAENLGLGLLSALFLQGYGRTLELLRLVKAATIYSGHPGLDVSFWALYLRSSELQRLIGTAQAEVLSTPLPVTSPIRESGIVQRQLYGFPDQAELDRLFEFGQFRDLAEVEAKLAEFRSHPLYNLAPEEQNSPTYGLRQRVASIEAGVMLRPFHELRQAIAQARYNLARATLGLIFAPPAAPGLPAMPLHSVDP